MSCCRGRVKDGVPALGMLAVLLLGSHFVLYGTAVALRGAAWGCAGGGGESDSVVPAAPALRPSAEWSPPKRQVLRMDGAPGRFCFTCSSLISKF
jgi:hypothetical protein